MDRKLPDFLSPPLQVNKKRRSIPTIGHDGSPLFFIFFCHNLSHSFSKDMPLIELSFSCETNDKAGRILRKHNQILLRTLLSAIISLGDSSPQKNDRMVGHLFFLHHHPQEAFELFFTEELKEKKEVAVVMREMSLSVVVLKYLLNPFKDRVCHTIFPLVSFGLRLSKKKKEVLMHKDSHTVAKSFPSYAKQKSKLKRALNFLLRSEMPDGLCVLCYKCVEITRANEEVQRVEGTPLSHWAVSAVLFLRFLIPMVTAQSLTEALSEKKEGLMIMSRMLMKLCTKSLFSGKTCVFNEVMEEAFGLYDQFCDEVVLKGKELSLGGEEVWNEKIEGKVFLEDGSLMKDFVERQKFTLLNVIQNEAQLDKKLILTDLLRDFQETLFARPLQKRRSLEGPSSLKDDQIFL